jgi:hypothetical protein
VGGARAIKEAREMFPKGKTWSSIVLLDAWSGACRYIMVGLLPVIDCLYFFFFLTTKMHNYPFFVCCLLKSGNHF